MLISSRLIRITAIMMSATRVTIHRTRDGEDSHFHFHQSHGWLCDERVMIDEACNFDITWLSERGVNCRRWDDDESRFTHRMHTRAHGRGRVASKSVPKEEGKAAWKGNWRKQVNEATYVHAYIRTYVHARRDRGKVRQKPVSAAAAREQS